MYSFSPHGLPSWPQGYISPQRGPPLHGFKGRGGAEPQNNPHGRHTSPCMPHPFSPLQGAMAKAASSFWATLWRIWGPQGLCHLEPSGPQWKLRKLCFPILLHWLIRKCHSQREQSCGCQRGGGCGRDGVGVCICRCKRLYIEWIDKARLYSTENHSQYPVMNHNGNESEKEHIWIYNWITLLYSKN